MKPARPRRLRATPAPPSGPPALTHRLVRRAPARTDLVPRSLRRPGAPPSPLDRRTVEPGAPVEILDAVSGPFERAIPADAPGPGRPRPRPRRG